jgi:hypothetical protein
VVVVMVVVAAVGYIEKESAKDIKYLLLVVKSQKSKSQ